MKNIALIGCGRIGFLLEQDPLRNKPCTHYGGAIKAGLKINYACDINSDRLTNFGQLAKIPPSNLFSNHIELLKAIKPDIVIISTWTDSHAEIAIAAAQHKTKIIVLEKPIAASIKQSHAIIDACKKNKSTLIINHERRFDSRYRKVKELLKQGTIGKPKTVSAKILTGSYKGTSSPEQGGGPLLHDGTHMVDIIRFFFGEITSVRGEFSRDKRKKGFEDRAIAWLKTTSAVDIFLEAGGSRDYFMFELDISCTGGRIIIGNGYERLYINKISQYYTGFKDLTEDPFPFYLKNNCFEELYLEIVSILNNKQARLTSTGFDGHKSLEVIHAVYASSHLKKTINMPLNNKNIDLKKIFNLS